MIEIGTVAIIGAGMAGLTCARALTDHGVRVLVIDKGRGLGGRIATRRGPFGSVDHGAVALSVAQGAPSDAPWAISYAAYLDAAGARGAAVYWPEAQGWVGVPGMSGLLQPAAQGVAVRLGAEVTGLAQDGGGWRLQGSVVPDMRFDQVILAIPQPQAMGLLGVSPDLQQAIAPARMRAVWTAMAGFDRPLPLPGNLIHCDDGPVATAIRSSAKPGRAGDGDAWVLHASADWTAARLELDKPEAAGLLLDAFLDSSGLDRRTPVWLEGHRWRYGLTATALGRPFVRDAGRGLSVCGDWCLGDSAADAFASGQALADALLGQ